nr:hypothetical protein [Tanacetum cinerariifolium]GEX35166.1 hypothetical protein [Tanacetum cinerariifolium]
MKGYVDQLERLGYVLPQDLSVGLILNCLTSDFIRFVRNNNMHNMGKTIDELHAMLIKYENGLPKKAKTPQVMMIKGGKIQNSNKKSLKAKDKGSCNNVNSIYNVRTKRAKHNLDSTYLWHCRLAHIKSVTRVLNMVPTTNVDKTLYELWYGKVSNLSYLKVWECEALVKRAIDLEEIQDEDTSPSEITNKIPMEVDGFEPPQE